MAGSRVSPSPSLEAGAGLRIGITVIVRSIGRATLHEALASVRAQQPGDVEVLVVDAAGTGAIDTAVEPAPRWLCFGRALHRTEAAQAGLDAVNTRHALFLDDDDWLLEGHLRKLTAALGASPDAVLAHTGVQMVDDTGGAASARGVFDAAFEPWELLLGNRFPIHAALFDVARLRAAGVAFDRSLDVYEDWDFWLQLAEVGPFVHVPGVSASYRVHDAASQVHRLQHGDEPFWCVWRKWWQRAPRAWWNRALYQREVVVGLNGELVAVRAERDEHARRRHEQDRLLHEQTLSMQQLSQSFEATIATLRGIEARLAEESARLADERARLHACERQLAERSFELDAARAQARAAAEHHAAQLQDREGLIRLLRAEHAAADLARRRLADTLAVFEDSISWRWSAPLRRAEAGARALRGRAGEWRRRWGWTPGGAEYQRWIVEVEEPALAERRAALAPLQGSARPQVSVLMPVFEPELAWLDEAIESLRAQWWPHWQLCLADDASAGPGVQAHLQAWAAREPRITLMRRTTNGGIAATTNDALALAHGDWVAFMDQDDRLAPQALAEVALAVHADPQAVLLFSDEDKLDARGRRFEPHFKPAFSIERLRGQNLLNHLVVMQRDRLLALGGLRSGFDGAQDHELLLRACESISADQVHHIPQVLYHWRAAPRSTAASPRHKAAALQAALRAVNDSLARCEPGAAAEGLPHRHWLRVRYPMPVPRPAVGGVDGPFGGAQPIQCWTVEGFAPAHEDWFAEMLSLLLREGVGLVGAAVVDARGRLIDGARVHDARTGGWRLLPASFGARSMVQAAACLAPGCWLMRGEVHARWLAAGGAARFQNDPDAAARWCEALQREGWRSLWTPFARFTRSG